MEQRTTHGILFESGPFGTAGVVAPVGEHGDRGVAGFGRRLTGALHGVGPREHDLREFEHPLHVLMDRLVRGDPVDAEARWLDQARGQVFVHGKRAQAVGIGVLDHHPALHGSLVGRRPFAQFAQAGPGLQAQPSLDLGEFEQPAHLQPSLAHVAHLLGSARGVEASPGRVRVVWNHLGAAGECLVPEQAVAHLRVGGRGTTALLAEPDHEGRNIAPGTSAGPGPKGGGGCTRRPQVGKQSGATVGICSLLWCPRTKKSDSAQKSDALPAERTGAKELCAPARSTRPIMKHLNFPGIPQILLVTASDTVASPLCKLLQGEGLLVRTVTTVREALDACAQVAPDLVYLDARLPGATSAGTMASLRQSDRPADVVFLAEEACGIDPLQVMREGAHDVIALPVDFGRTLATTRQVLELRQLRAQVAMERQRVQGLVATEAIGLTPAMRALQQRVLEVSAVPDSPALLQGEAGSGKELAARSIHENSSRKHGPFQVVNCSGLQGQDLEAALFGQEAGISSFARGQAREGLFALAAGGTILLDEVAAMDPALQGKLVRAMRDRTYRRVGGTEDSTFDVRILASSTIDLRGAMERGAFRAELFHQLQAGLVEVPSLRVRAADIPLLAHSFLDQFRQQMGRKLSGFTEEAMENLVEHSWPGNVRELRNVIERACIACKGGMIQESHLPSFSGGSASGTDRIAPNEIVLHAASRSLETIEGQLIARVLEETNWNISRAAAQLGINRTTLYNKIRLHKLVRRQGSHVATA